MKEKLLELKRIIDDIRYELSRARVEVDDETWDFLNKASKDSAQLVIDFEDLLKIACEEYAKKELNNEADNNNV
jgi:hypothetical protein